MGQETNRMSNPTKRLNNVLADNLPPCELSRDRAIVRREDLVAKNLNVDQQTLVAFMKAIGYDVHVKDIHRVYRDRKRTKIWKDYDEDWSTLPDRARNQDLAWETELDEWVELFRATIEHVGRLIFTKVYVGDMETNLGWVGPDAEDVELKPESLRLVLDETLIMAGIRPQVP